MNTIPELRARVRQATAELKAARQALRAAQGKPAPPKPRARIRTRPKGGTWKADRLECDKLMARIVKFEHPACMNCHRTDRYRLQWAHGFSRKYNATRYDVENSFVLCDACHMVFTYNPIAWTAWMRLRLGPEKYEALERRAQLMVRFDPRILLGLRGRAEELGVATDEGWRAWQEAA